MAVKQIKMAYSLATEERSSHGAMEPESGRRDWVNTGTNGVSARAFAGVDSDRPDAFYRMVH